MEILLFCHSRKAKFLIYTEQDPQCPEFQSFSFYQKINLKFKSYFNNTKGVILWKFIDFIYSTSFKILEQIRYWNKTDTRYKVTYLAKY